MGNLPTSPSLQHLPIPENAEFKQQLEAMGLVFEGQRPMQGEVTVPVRVPEGWFLYGNESYCSLHSADGTKLATISGKYTSYDAYCYMHAAGADAPKLDVTQGVVNESGWFMDAQTRFDANVRDYRRRCSAVMGYQESHQTQCDEAYRALQKQATELGVDLPVKRIVLGFDQAGSGLNALGNAVTGAE